MLIWSRPNMEASCKLSSQKPTPLNLFPWQEPPSLEGVTVYTSHWILEFIDLGRGCKWPGVNTRGSLKPTTQAHWCILPSSVSPSLSLSLVGTSISPDREHLLREQVATKMSQGSLYAGNGQVTTLDPEWASYSFTVREKRFAEFHKVCG